jgi:hypothetical protein
VLGVAAAVFMVLAEVSNLFTIEVDTATCQDLADPEQADACERTGGEQHSWAFVPVAVLTALMAVGAGLGGSRPAGLALLAAGVVVLAITLVGDLPDTNETGEIGFNFTSARAVKGSGFWFELVGGALAAGAGALRLLRPPARAVSPRPRRP